MSDSSHSLPGSSPGPDRLALYISPWCPYCRYVTAAISKLDMQIELRDVRDAVHRNDLLAATGRRTVPVLRITHPDGRDEWMPESRDIVRYLHGRVGHAA